MFVPRLTPFLVTVRKTLQRIPLGIFTLYAHQAAIFPEKGDVLEVTCPYCMTMRHGLQGEWMTQWMERGSHWLVLRCSWEACIDKDGLPSTDGTATMVGYGRTSGFIEIRWTTNTLGTRGIVIDKVWGGHMKRLFDRRGV